MEDMWHVDPLYGCGSLADWFVSRERLVGDLAKGYHVRGTGAQVLDEVQEKTQARLQQIVALLTKGEQAVQDATSSALRALSADSKVALIESGAMREVRRPANTYAHATLVRNVAI
eukprot:66006-Prorocentrum_minimum.AAC.1